MKLKNLAVVLIAAVMTVMLYMIGATVFSAGICSEHNHSDSEWTVLNSNSPAPGKYYLDGTTNRSLTISPSSSGDGEFVLCLNGNTLNGTITVNTGATLTVCDYSDNHTGKISTPSAISVKSGGTLYIYGATINTTLYDNAISVSAGGTATIDEVTINITGNDGGSGVYIDGSGANVTIKNSTVSTTGRNTYGMFVKYGAVTVINSTIRGTGSGSRGIYSQHGSVYLYGAAVSCNNASASCIKVEGSPTLDIHAGSSITGGITGIENIGGTVTIDTDSGSYTELLKNLDVTVTGTTHGITNAVYESDGNIPGKITIGSENKPDDGGSITVSGGAAGAGIYISGSSSVVTINDGDISGGSYGINITQSTSTTLNINGGTIQGTGSTSTGVRCINKVNITGGRIAGKRYGIDAYFQTGNYNCVLTVSNTAEIEGGSQGIHFTPSSGSSLTVSGGSIKGTNSGSYGIYFNLGTTTIGNDNLTLDVSGGYIEGTTNGIKVEYAGATFKLSGDPEIKGGEIDYKGAAGIYLVHSRSNSTGALITITGELTYEGACTLFVNELDAEYNVVGDPSYIFTNTAPEGDTDGNIILAYNNPEKFKSAVRGYEVKRNSDNKQLWLYRVTVVTFVYDPNPQEFPGTVSNNSEDKRSVYYDETYAGVNDEPLPEPKKVDHKFKGWYYYEGDNYPDGSRQGPITAETPVITDGNHKLYAEWGYGCDHQGQENNPNWEYWTYDDKNDDEHTRTCELCGHVCGANDGQSYSCGELGTKHDYDYGNPVETTAPTCTEKAVDTVTCKLCHGTKEVEGRDELGHDPGDWEYKDSSTHVKKCQRQGCGAEVYSDSHDSAEWKPHDPDDGSHYKYCSTCKHDYASEGHKTSDDDKWTNCSEDGHNDHVQDCSVCDEPVHEDHSFDKHRDFYTKGEEPGDYKAPSASEDGYQWWICKCGNRYQEILKYTPPDIPDETTTSENGGNTPSESTTPENGGKDPSESTTPENGGSDPSESTTPENGGSDPSESTTPENGGSDPSESTTPENGGNTPSESTTPENGGGSDSSETSTEPSESDPSGSSASDPATVTPEPGSSSSSSSDDNGNDDDNGNGDGNDDDNKDTSTSTPSADPEDPEVTLPPGGSTTNPLPDNGDDEKDPALPPTYDETQAGNGSVIVRVEVDEGAPKAGVSSESMDKLAEEGLDRQITKDQKEKVLSGGTLEIVLTIADLDMATDNAQWDRRLTLELINQLSYAEGRYLDIEIIKLLNDQYIGNINELEAPIRVTIEIPEELRGTNRSFSMVRVHNGEAEMLTDWDSDPDTLTILSDKFSTYAIVYKDDTSGSSSDNPYTGVKQLAGIAVLVLAGTAGTVLAFVRQKSKK